MDEEQQEKSYFSKDEKSQEELLHFLINAMNDAFHLEKLESLVNVLQGKVIKNLLRKIEPFFENISGCSLSMIMDDGESSDIRYSNLTPILNAIKKYFDYKIKVDHIKLINDFSLDTLIDVKELAHGTTKDLHTFCKILLLVGAVSSQKQSFLNKFDDYAEVYLEEFVEIVDSFMKIEEDNNPTIPLGLSKERRFTTRSSILLGCQDTLVNRMFDHLRQKLEDLEENKISLEKAMKKRDEEKTEMQNNMTELELKCKAIEQKEEEYKDDIQHYKDELNKQKDLLGKERTLHSEKETLLSTALQEKEQELALLKENFSYLQDMHRQELQDLEGRISELKKANEEKVMVKQENETLKRRFSGIDLGLPREIEVLKKDKNEYLEIIVNLRTEKNKLLGKINELQNSLKSEAEQNSSLNKTISNLEQKIQNCTRASPVPQEFSIEDIQSPWIRASTDIPQINAQVSKGPARKPSLLDLFQEEYQSEYQTTVSQLQDELHQKEERLALALKELTVIQHENEELLKTNNDLKEKNTVSNEVVSLKELVKEKEKTIAELIEAKQEKTDDLSALQKENQNLIATLNKTQEMLDNEKSKCTENLRIQENFAKEWFNITLLEHNKLTTHLQNEIVSLKSVCENEQKSSREKEEIIKNLQESQQKITTDFECTIQNLKEEIQIKNQNILQVNKDFNAFQQEKFLLTKELNELHTSYSTLKSQKEKLIEEVKNLNLQKRDDIIYEEQKDSKSKNPKQIINFQYIISQGKDDSPVQRKIQRKISGKLSDGMSTQRESLSNSKNEGNPSEFLGNLPRTTKSLENNWAYDNKHEIEIMNKNEEIKKLNEKVKILITENKKNEQQIKENIRKYQAEIMQRDEDIEFLKRAYEYIKDQSKKEYDIIASSLYELAMQFSRIKYELQDK